MTLKTRFSVTLIGHTLISLTLFGGTYFIVAQRAALRFQQEEQKKTLTRIISVCREMHIALSPIMAVNYLRNLRTEPGFLSAGCVGERGLVRAHSDPKMIGTTLREPVDFAILLATKVTRRNREIAGARILEWYAPVASEDSQLGFAMLGYDARHLNDALNLEVLDNLRQPAFVAAATLPLAIVLGLVLAWSLSRPIQRLVETARRIGDGDLDYRTEIINRGDELGFLAQEMNSMAQKLKQLDELKSDFIQNVSHDLRSPMAAIRMYVECMLTTDPDREKFLPRHREWLTIVMDNAMRLNVFVTNILDAAKMKAGQLELHPQPISIEKAARAIQALFLMVARNQNIALDVDVPPDLPSIIADPIRFDQVLTNLVSNALKFTPPGGKVRIEARVDGKCVAVSVSDTGRGIAPEGLARLFERFRQLDVRNQTGTAIPGTGLGLFITKATVQAMGGQISVQSQLGTGSRFIVLMPAGDQNDAA